MEEQTPLVRWSRLGAMALAWLFTAGVAIQIFLAGLALFDTAERWDDHSSFGMMIGILVLPLLVLVPLGRAGRQLIGMTVVMVVLYILQINLPNIDASYVAALHPLVAFALLGMSGQLGSRLRDLALSDRQAAAPHPEASFNHG
jgi:hypothetical protein